MKKNLNINIPGYQGQGSNALNTNTNTYTPTNSLTPFADQYWEDLKSTDQGLQNAMNVKWGEYQRNTQYQTAVNDLKEAGLNPVLAATGLSGAGIASNAMSNTTKQTEMNNITSIMSTALSILGMVILKKL